MAANFGWKVQKNGTRIDEKENHSEKTSEQIIVRTKSNYLQRVQERATKSNKQNEKTAARAGTTKSGRFLDVLCNIYYNS